MKIVQAPDPVLSTKAKPIALINKAILDLIEEMKYTLLHTTDPEGVGLAAPQVGKSLQLFIVKPGKQAPFSIFINPQITLANHVSKKKKSSKKSDEQKQVTNNKLEGCLSLKDIWGTVTRSPKVSINYLDEFGKKQKKTYTGFFAIILQHEYDHLEGILFPKRVLEQKGKLYKSHKDEKGEDVFDPIEL